MTRRNLLLARSYLGARQVTSYNVHLPDSLIEAGFTARAQYHNYLRQEEKRKTDEELQRSIAAEKKKLDEIAKKDRVRLSELAKLRDLEDQENQKKRVAMAATVEAERALQKAMADLQSAHKLQEDASIAVCGIQKEIEM